MPNILKRTVVAVSSEGPTLDDRLDARFGRARGFMIVDIETMAARYLDNGASQGMGHGAGIQTARRIADAGAGVLLTGVVGPKAVQALAAAGIKIVQDLEGMTVREAVQRFKSGALAASDAPGT
jgi:predicted Fe-Mo cluster-binding NifX family protein